MNPPSVLAGALALLVVLPSLRAAWTVESVDATANTGEAASLALHPTTEAPAIVYNRWHGPTFPNNFYPYIAMKTGATWLPEALGDSLTNVSRATSVGFNLAGEPAATFTYGFGRIQYRVRSGGVWSSPLDVAVNNGSGFSSLVMQGNTPVVAFIDTAGADLEFASINNGAFTNSELDTTGAGGPVSMAQSGSVMAIAYLKGGKLEVFSSFSSGSTWGFNSALPNTFNATYCALTIAPATKGDLAVPRSHVIFFDSSNGRYFYTTEDTDTGLWTAPEIIYESGPDTLSLFGLSIAVGSDSVPQVAFLDYGSKRLAYSKRVNGAWTTPEFPDGANLGGVNASLKLSSTNRPRIAFAALASPNNSAVAGLKFAALDPANPAGSLSLAVSGKPRRSTLASAINVRGTASARATSIQWRIGSGKFRARPVANGRWTARVRPLKVGRNVVFFRARDGAESSPVRKITVTRRE